MNSKRNVVIGLILLLLIVIFPFLYNFAVKGSAEAPELELPKGETRCVEDKDFMMAHHMQLLNEWRDAVVRRGEKTYRSQAFGDTYDMSLNDTCMKCHSNRENFCDRCHNYADVQPYCWECHFEPKGDASDGQK
jgi:hypothetical protein